MKLKNDNKQEKKILVIPALFDHIDIINEILKRGYIAITCDNNPNNIGHKYSTKFKNIDLLDTPALLKFSKKEKINAIMTLSNDIGALPAAYISHQLNLPGSKPNAVKIMANKNYFRSFLKANSFNCPKYQTIEKYEDVNLKSIDFPIIIKPTDRTGSKGVFIAKDIEELKQKIFQALEFSIEKKVIIEKYIESKFNQIHGDSIVQNNKIIFYCFGDQYFGKDTHKFSPIATVFPCSIPLRILNKIQSELNRFIELIDYKNGGLNIELRIDNNENVYFIEIAPRFGGNYIPKTIGYVCDLDIFQYALDLAIGKNISIPYHSINPNIFQLILRSNTIGIFNSVSCNNNQLEIMQDFQFKNKGEYITDYPGPDDIISIYIIKAPNKKIVRDVITNPYRYFSINLNTKENSN
ncbi:ATP-grasp domain-containing protein [Plebeiibacterium marinum]|uniref:ATP-grasp domain-containing protein n=1 Tax=Plebeiibacterium marinum TaxID=2992111 RepID=A0AAE3MH46_9BACT|nr:ATP-grasp domain-containing protein [Plebeiobacterium marinum]MCW3807391.1 ATP-grasp domain-containing protein [Plebeiobacterium marinum]